MRYQKATGDKRRDWVISNTKISFFSAPATSSDFAHHALVAKSDCLPARSVATGSTAEQPAASGTAKQSSAAGCCKRKAEAMLCEIRSAGASQVDEAEAIGRQRELDEMDADEPPKVWSRNGVWEDVEVRPEDGAGQTKNVARDTAAAPGAMVGAVSLSSSDDEDRQEDPAPKRGRAAQPSQPSQMVAEPRCSQ